MDKPRYVGKPLVSGGQRLSLHPQSPTCTVYMHLHTVTSGDSVVVKQRLCCFYLCFTVHSHIRIHCLKQVRQRTNTWEYAQLHARENKLSGLAASKPQTNWEWTEFVFESYGSCIGYNRCPATYIMVFSLCLHQCSLDVHSVTLNCAWPHHVQSQYRQARGNLHHGCSLAGCCIRLSESSTVHTVFAEWARVKQWHW